VYVVETSPYFCGFKRGATEGLCCPIFFIYADNSFLENMSVVVLDDDHFTEVLGA
jgi:hypothetical protein